MKRPLTALALLTFLASVPASSAIAGGTASYTASPHHRSPSAYHVYLPMWLPSGFRQVHDPAIARYPETAAKFFMRRYGARGRWVSIFEGPAGCCLDSLPSHRVGSTKLSGRQVAYFSNQGERFGGLYLFWDQVQTYIAINSPKLSKQILVRVARSVAPTSIVHHLIATTRPPAMDRRALLPVVSCVVGASISGPCFYRVVKAGEANRAQPRSR